MREILELEPSVRSTIGVDQPYPVHSPEEFAPALPIKRIPATTTLARKVHEQLGNRLQPLLSSRCRYDFGQNAIFAREVTPELLLRNYLLGYPADADLAQAILIERWDNDASYDGLAQFFHHVYCALNGEMFRTSACSTCGMRRRRSTCPTSMRSRSHARSCTMTATSRRSADKRREALYETISKYFALPQLPLPARGCGRRLFLEKKPLVKKPPATICSACSPTAPRRSMASRPC
ncbi:MAG: hypothetical protein U1E76_27165 [Planctomycetota bacterium]